MPYMIAVSLEMSDEPFFTALKTLNILPPAIHLFTIT